MFQFDGIVYLKKVKLLTISKKIKIVIPIIIVIAIGIFLGLSAISSDNPKQVIPESTEEFETKDTGDIDIKDPNLDPDVPTKTEQNPPVLVGEVTVIDPTPVIETVKEDQLVRKTIPPNYKFGNFFNNELIRGMDWTALDSDQIHSIRFTNKHTGDIDSITISLNLRSPNEVIVGIQEDNGKGYPSGNWMNEESYVKKVIQPNQGIYDFELPKNIHVSQGKVYHILVQKAPLLSGILTSDESFEINGDESPVTIRHFKGNTPHQPFNPKDPDIYWPDPAINSLNFNGDYWVILDKWPIYLISYMDGKVDGQPYTLMANWIVQDGTPVGQTIITHSDYSISKFSFFVSKNGNPPDDLFYGIQDIDNNLLATGLFAKSNELTNNPMFIEVVLDESIDLKAGELYRFFVYSPIPRGTNNYNLFGHEFSINQTIGYGGITHRLSTGTDFEHWGDWSDADAVFALVTSQ